MALSSAWSFLKALMAATPLPVSRAPPPPLPPRQETTRGSAAWRLFMIPANYPEPTADASQEEPSLKFQHAKISHLDFRFEFGTL